MGGQCFRTIPGTYKIPGKPAMVQSVKEILEQNGFDTAMIGVIDFVTNYFLSRRMLSFVALLVFILLVVILIIIA
jgi:hypothetical protein